MCYEVINRELKIEACNIGDLTLDQVQRFLRLWGDNSSIITLTMFLKNDGTVVLNKDNKEYEFYKELSYKFLSSNDEKREMFKEKVPECYRETLNTLESALKIRRTKELLRVLKYNFAEVDNISYGVLKRIFEDYESGAMGLFKIFTLGYIEGKRAERTRRKEKK